MLEYKFSFKWNLYVRGSYSIWTNIIMKLLKVDHGEPHLLHNIIFILLPFQLSKFTLTIEKSNKHKSM